MASLLYRSRELDLLSESTVRRAYITLNGLPRRPIPIREFPGERPDLLKLSIDLLDGAGVNLAKIAADLQMNPRHVRRLADIDDPQPKLTLVPNQPDDPNSALAHEFMQK